MYVTAKTTLQTYEPYAIRRMINFHFTYFLQFFREFIHPRKFLKLHLWISHYPHNGTGCTTFDYFYKAYEE